MKAISKTLLAMLAVFVSLAANAQIQSPEVYEAHGKICDDCKGAGKVTCNVCRGEDLTKLTCLTCKGYDLTQQACLTCKGYDLTKQVCLTCKGQDLTQQACLTCKGYDLTQQACPTCKGSGRTTRGRCYSCNGGGKRSVCYTCNGTGRRSVCYSCNGTGRRSVCYSCNGTGKRSACYSCSGSGKRSPCYSCSGKASAGTLCQTCNGIGAVEVLVAKHSNLDGLKKSIASQSPTVPRAPPLSTVSGTFTAEDGSSYGEISKDTGRPKTVFVRGYTRKDGTYVNSHYRSFPSSQVVSKEPGLRFSPAVAENGSYYGEPNQNGVPKTVSVGGYFRKDGTYVRGHYRSAPRR